MDLVKDFFPTTFLFDSMSSDEIEDALRHIRPQITEYKRGDLIFSPEEYETKVGFILDGKCEVLHMRSEMSAVSLNILDKRRSFGILAALSAAEEYPTTIRAKTGCKILFITQGDLLTLINKSPKIAQNVIKFLSGKITFLNKKIATFSAESVEKKLAAHLLSEMQKYGSRIFPFNCKKCSESINSGRASVYRILEEFEIQGYVKHVERKIYINDPQGLERTKK